MSERENRNKLREEYRARTQVGGIIAITCIETGKRVIKKTLDLKGSQNHFEFSKMTGSCVEPQFSAEWKQYGPSGFSFEILETLEKKETQTESEFAEDIAALEKLCLGKE